MFAGMEVRVISATMFFVNKLFLIVKFEIVSFVFVSARTELNACPAASIFVIVFGLRLSCEQSHENGHHDDDLNFAVHF